MKKYNKPEMDIIILSTENLLTNSGDNSDEMGNGDNFFPDFS